MLTLGGAAALFLLAHLLPAAPGVRPRLVALLGERFYLAAYSALSLALLLFVAVAAIRAPAILLWTAPAWTHVVPLAVMPFAFMLIGAGLAAPNPLSVSLSTATFNPQAPGVAGVLRHPVLWGFGLWSAAHIPPNGVLGQAFFFAVMTAFAVAGGRRLDRKRRLTLGPEAWAAIDKARRASSPRCLFEKRTLLGAAIGFFLYAGFLAYWHELLFGVDPMQIGSGGQPAAPPAHASALTARFAVRTPFF
ncbi:MAG TPA: NnrU family protein [Parvularcula sp.]|nr:NnrU family protein [Parvularcula sp.]